jgi:2-methylaconitate cis-trans-isomerase PrpF
MSEQESIRCVIMRGGTSKGLYFRELDLPRPGPIRDWLLLRQHLFGSRAVRDRRGQGRRAGRRGRCPDLEHQHGKVLIASVQVKDGKALVLGDCAVPGVPGTGAEILMSWVGTVGAKTGQLLPAGTVLDRFEMGSGAVLNGTLCDVANPVTSGSGSYRPASSTGTARSSCAPSCPGRSLAGVRQRE